MRAVQSCYDLAARREDSRLPSTLEHRHRCNRRHDRARAADELGEVRIGRFFSVLPPGAGIPSGQGRLSISARRVVHAVAASGRISLRALRASQGVSRPVTREACRAGYRGSRILRCEHDPARVGNFAYPARVEITLPALVAVLVRRAQLPVDATGYELGVRSARSARHPHEAAVRGLARPVATAVARRNRLYVHRARRFARRVSDVAVGVVQPGRGIGRLRGLRSDPHVSDWARAGLGSALCTSLGSSSAELDEHRTATCLLRPAAALRFAAHQGQHDRSRGDELGRCRLVRDPRRLALVGHVESVRSGAVDRRVGKP